MAGFLVADAGVYVILTSDRPFLNMKEVISWPAGRSRKRLMDISC